MSPWQPFLSKPPHPVSRVYDEAQATKLGEVVSIYNQAFIRGELRARSVKFTVGRRAERVVKARFLTPLSCALPSP